MCHVAVAMAYIMHVQRTSFDAAYELVKSRRSFVEKDNFEAQLRKYGEQLAPPSSAVLATSPAPPSPSSTRVFVKKSPVASYRTKGGTPAPLDHTAPVTIPPVDVGHVSYSHF